MTHGCEDGPVRKQSPDVHVSTKHFGFQFVRNRFVSFGRDRLVDVTRTCMDDCVPESGHENRCPVVDCCGCKRENKRKYVHVKMAWFENALVEIPDLTVR